MGRIVWGSMKIIDDREGGVHLIRGVYKNNIDEATGGSTKIKCMTD